MGLGEFPSSRVYTSGSHRLIDHCRRNISILPSLHSLLRRRGSPPYGGPHHEDPYWYHRTGCRLGLGNGRSAWHKCDTCFSGVFAIGAGFAGLAGRSGRSFLGVNPALGFDILMDAFVVIVVGGFGSLLGALVASLMIGLLQSFGVLLLPKFALVFQFALMALVLIIRPTGLFGDKE